MLPLAETRSKGMILDQAAMKKNQNERNDDIIRHYPSLHCLLQTRKAF